jgi:hypothetical protein
MYGGTMRLSRSSLRTSALLSTAVLVAASAGAQACGDDANGGTTPAADAAAAETGSDGASSTPDGAKPADGSSTLDAPSTGDSTTADAALAAPILDQVKPLDAGDAGDGGDANRTMHIQWTNVTPDCDAVEGEHKWALSGGYLPRFSVSGSTTSYEDTTNYQNFTQYTYHLRCKKGSNYSPFSNEVSGMFP